ncbi:Bug family tripartite tricarboxylate transporter substrate binding protein [Roseovarius sp. 2305UL8-3]|uniref:Bug family tripartite tricarboxylate transporter substrate binding protein n=1 Tax=Roseovarius conchicola TaxID=3121636 RepID=UPI003528098B
MKLRNRIKTVAATAVLMTTLATAAVADWAPSGPIKLLIGFGAGGGTDTQARLLATEIEGRHGWRIIPENVAGAGGAVMAAGMKDAPADGLTIGLAIDTTFSYGTINNDSIALEDFTYITTTAASQFGVLARADSGWKTLADVQAAAQAGEKIVWTNVSPLTQLASEVVAKHLGIEVNHVNGSGGKAGVNALVAQDANLAWAGGAQRGLVAAGEIVILASAESESLVQNPDGETLADVGIPQTFGFKFTLAAPAGLPDEARDAIADAVVGIITDDSTETAQFIAKQYPPAAVVLTGDELSNYLSSQKGVYESLLAQFGN